MNFYIDIYIYILYVILCMLYMLHIMSHYICYIYLSAAPVKLDPASPEATFWDQDSR